MWRFIGLTFMAFTAGLVLGLILLMIQGGIVIG